MFGRDVEVVGDKKDRYGRTIARILVADPQCREPSCPKALDAGLEQVRAGMAWWYKQYSKEQAPQDREDYEVAEFNAKVRRLGLWADKDPVAP